MSLNIVFCLLLVQPYIVLMKYKATEGTFSFEGKGRKILSSFSLLYLTWSTPFMPITFLFPSRPLSLFPTFFIHSAARVVAMVRRV